jgi:beta-barrel assembly-enhancing protease
MSCARAGAAIGWVLLTACVGTGAPALDAETLRAAQLDQGRRLASATLEVKGRLANLDLALTLASREFCGGLARPKLGGVFGASRSFSGAVRTVAEETYRVGEEPTVVHVTPGGPLAVAGIQPGDRVVAVDGRRVASIEQVDERVQAHPQRLALTLRRGSRKLERSVLPASTCPVSLEVAQSPGLMPWKASTLVGAVPLGLLDFLDDDAELAAVLGHQLAHLLFDRESDDPIARERRADRLGLYLAARAGYDVSAAPRVWERLAAEAPYLIFPPASPLLDAALPHTMLAARMDGIRSVATEIEQLRSQGRPLVPSDG